MPFLADAEHVAVKQATTVSYVIMDTQTGFREQQHKLAEPLL